MKTLGKTLLLLTTACSTAQFADNSRVRTRVNTPPPAGSNATPQPFELQVVDGVQTPVSLVLSAATKQLKQSFSMVKAPPTTRLFTQVDRPQTNDAKTQGKAGQPGSENLAVVESRELNILIIVSDAPGAASYQDLLAKSFADTVSAIDFADWQIAVATTTSSCFTDVITRAAWHNDQAGTQTRFTKAVSVGETGTGPDRGIEMASLALKGDCFGNNTKWIQDGSVATVLIVTPLENCVSPSGVTCEATGAPHVTPAEFISSAPAGTRVYGLLDTTATCGAPADPTEYLSLVAQSGASSAPLCQTDYGATLSGFSNQISSTTQRDFTLAQTPDANSVHLFINGQPFQSDFQVNGNSLVFTGNPLPPPDATVNVAYTFGGTPEWSQMQLGQPAVAGSLTVTIGGESVDPADYTYDPTSGTLSFSPQPPDGKLVLAQYRVDTPLPNSFSVNTSPEPTATAVYVNGAPVTDYSVSADQIVFAAPPADAAQIRIVYNTQTDFQTHYPSAAGDAQNVDSFEFLATDSGQQLACALEGDQIVCPLGIVESQSAVTAVFETRQSSVVLPQDPVPGTLHVTPANDSQACSTTLDPETRQVTYACPDQALPPSLDVAYEYIANFTTTFSVAGAPATTTSWKVTIDGVPTTDFTVSGGIVTVNDPSLVVGSSVDISAEP